MCEGEKKDLIVVPNIAERLKIPANEDQVREDFTNGGRGHPPKHLKFFLLVF